MNQNQTVRKTLLITVSVLMWWSLPGCISIGNSFLWENSRVETDMIVVEATPAKFVKILITQLDILEFTLTVSNKTDQQLYFYPLRLKVSGFNKPGIGVYISDIVAYSRDFQYPLNPKSQGSLTVYISAMELDFQLVPHLRLQVAEPPIAEVVK